MAFISIELAGKKTFGGYLRIDNGAQIKLVDNLIIYVSEGTHYLSFSSESAASRTMTKMNAAVGNYKTAAWNERNSVDGSITHTFDSNDVMFFTVVSDAAGHILDEPTFTVREFDEEEMKKAEALYEEQQKEISDSIKADKKGAGLELLLCIFLGFLGAHKFYRKRFLMGILYLFTFGLFGIGTVVDFFKILGKIFRRA